MVVASDALVDFLVPAFRKDATCLGFCTTGRNRSSLSLDTKIATFGHEIQEDGVSDTDLGMLDAGKLTELFESGQASLLEATRAA